ncbi:MAG: 3'(2'),5'-bisphosphate nucleotidase CysQ, partial [Nanoarchaeota archaeon]|nr:3'(2'),5'-bisphosphate nucleotidase CysQ [Nanoarchaeota archaeon]
MKIDIQKIIEIAKKAGDAVMKIYSEDFSVEIKADKSPLTEADLASERMIIASLKHSYPSIPILSEEKEDEPYSVRKDWHCIWLVDPLDGTKEFVKRNGEFTVNIGLVKDGLPVLGVVYAPAKNLLYYGDEEGSFKQEGDGPPFRI